MSYIEQVEPNVWVGYDLYPWEIRGRCSKPLPVYMVVVASGVSEQAVRDGLAGTQVSGTTTLRGLRRLKEILESLPGDVCYVTTADTPALVRLATWKKEGDFYVRVLEPR